MAQSNSKPQSYGKNGLPLPPFSPLPSSDSSLPSSSSVKDVSMEEVDVSSTRPALGGSSSYKFENAFSGNYNSLPPRKGHGRSNSDVTDVPLGFDAFIRTSPQLVPISARGFIANPTHGNDKYEIHESLEKSDHEIVFGRLDERRDELYGSYVTRDYVSGGFGDGFDCCNNEGTIISKEQVAAGIHLTNKRSADGDLAHGTRHFRSLSVDSSFGNLKFGDQSPNLLPSLIENQRGPFSSIHSASENSAEYNLDFRNGEFTESELRKLKTDERLAELALLDPKRAKRVLANRQSAARSKERKTHYILELEHKVQALQTEAATLSAQLTILQKDFTEITNYNSELKFRLKAIEQQARLRDALHEALTAEVQHVKLATTDIGEDGAMIRQMPMKHHHHHHHHHVVQMQQYHQSNHLQQFSEETPESSRQLLRHLSQHN